MFAFAVWDKQTRQLILGRDRLGEKPLYYGWQGQGEQAVFLFGSELKALRAHPAFENTINRGALSLQLRHNYIPAPYSIYNGIAKLRPGCLLTVSMQQREAKEWSYWSALQAAESGAANLFTGSAVRRFFVRWCGFLFNRCLDAGSINPTGKKLLPLVLMSKAITKRSMPKPLPNI